MPTFPSQASRCSDNVYRRTPRAHPFFASLLALHVTGLWAPAAPAAALCGPLRASKNAVFFDYTDGSSANRWHIRDVYLNHFAYILAELKKPNPRERELFRQVKYILNRIPNHYRALDFYGRLYKKYPALRRLISEDAALNSARPMTPECVFDRAIRFHPKDPTPRLLYGLFFHRIGKLKSALGQYRTAAKMRPNWAEVHYNMGLVYLRQKDYAAARVQAKKAYALGYPLPALRNKLKKAGVWP